MVSSELRGEKRNTHVKAKNKITLLHDVVITPHKHLVVLFISVNVIGLIIWRFVWLKVCLNWWKCNLAPYLYNQVLTY